MAYIKQRGEYWRAEVRRKGYKATYRTFDTQKQAQQWARRVESEMDSGLYIDRSEAAQDWMLQFVRWYNQVHKHSGLIFVTPEQRLCRSQAQEP